MAASDDGLLARWSRRKAQGREGALRDETVVVPAVTAPPAVPAGAASAPVLPDPGSQPPASDETPADDPPPTLADVAKLTRDSHFGRFVQPDVEPAVKNAALKKLFADPQFNVMDGLDTYIDDYGKPDPLPLHMLRKMAQAKFLGLVDDDEDEQQEEPSRTAAPVSSVDTPLSSASNSEAPVPEPLPHEDTDLRLQPHDAAGCAGAEPGAGQDRGGER